MAGDEDDGQRRAALHQAVLQFQAAHAVHPDVGDQAGHLTGIEPRQEGLRRVEALDAVVLAFEQPLQRIADGLVVINDVNGAFFWNQTHGKPWTPDNSERYLCVAGDGSVKGIQNENLHPVTISPL